MKIATWNVNGIRAREKQLCEWIERDKPDVLCLQELKAEPSQIPERCRHADYHAYWHGLRGYSGVSIHIRRHLMQQDPEFRHPEFDMESRMVQLAFENVVLASVYVPNGGKDFPAKIAFVTRLADWVRQLHAEGREIILCGDLNITRAEIDVHPRERDAGAIGQRPEERALFAELLGDRLVDVGRAFHPDDETMFTWWAPWRNMRQRNIGWRLDYVLASNSIAARAVSCNVLTDIGTSDHAPVMMTLGD